MSENRLNGEVSFAFALSGSNTLLDLSINRLLGRLPALLNGSNVNVLQGNLFGCDELPASDPDRSDYVCGFSDFNLSATFAITVFGVCAHFYLHLEH